MNKHIEEIKKFCSDMNIELRDYPSMLELSKAIALYAHRNQRRENGEPYVNHPLRVLEKYYDIIIYKNVFSQELDLMQKYNIPCGEIKCVCVLHDVVEDSELTMNDLYEIFDYFHGGDYFKSYVATPLSYITHDKSVDYKEYIEIVMKDPTSALVKLLDLQDNLNILSLNEFDEKNYERATKYLGYIKMINDKYHFIENAALYREEFNEMMKELKPHYYIMEYKRLVRTYDHCFFEMYLNNVWEDNRWVYSGWCDYDWFEEISEERAMELTKTYTISQIDIDLKDNKPLY